MYASFLEGALVGFRVIILSQQLSLLQDLGYVALSLHVIVQETTCCVTLDHGGVQGGTCLKMSQDSPDALHRSQSLQVNSPNSAARTSHESMLGYAGPSQVHQLCPYILSSNPHGC